MNKRLLVLLCFAVTVGTNVTAEPSCPDPKSPEAIQQEMEAKTKLFEDLDKIKGAEEALAQFPCVTHLLSFALEDLTDRKKRIPLIVSLAAASFRFDDTNAAVDTVIFDYMKNIKAYEAEIKRQNGAAPSERQERLNRLLIAFRGYAREMPIKKKEPDIVK